MAKSSHDEDIELLEGCLKNDRKLQKQLYQKQGGEGHLIF